MAETFTKESWWADLEKLGESAVRVNLATKVYGDTGGKRALVVEWLHEKDQEREDRRASQKNIRDTVAAIAAIIAAVAATIGAIVSIMTYLQK